MLYTSSTASNFPRLSWPDRLFYSVLLFKLEISVGPPYSTWLAIARWLAPLTTAYAGYRVIADIFNDRWARFRANRVLRSHVVVCGLGRCGLRIATADWGMPIVAIEHAPSATDIEHCRERGVVLIVGEATDAVVLGQAGLKRAKYMFVVCGDDGTNAEVGLLAREIVQKRHPPLECFVPVYDERACDLLQKAIDLGRGASVGELRVLQHLPQRTEGAFGRLRRGTAHGLRWSGVRRWWSSDRAASA